MISVILYFNHYFYENFFIKTCCSLYYAYQLMSICEYIWWWWCQQPLLWGSGLLTRWVNWGSQKQPWRHHHRPSFIWIYSRCPTVFAWFSLYCCCDIYYICRFCTPYFRVRRWKSEDYKKYDCICYHRTRYYLACWSYYYFCLPSTWDYIILCEHKKIKV